MDVSSRDTQDDALLMVRLRNQFYKKKYYFAITLYLLSLVVIGVLVSVLIYLIKNPSAPLYFVTDSVSRLIQDVPVESPNMPTEDVANWVTEAIETAYSYDFVNYRAELQEAQKYFTDYGWFNYMNGLKASNNLLALTQRQYVIVAKIVEKPKLLVEGILGGRYAWKFQIPLLVTYSFPPFDNKSNFENPLLLTVVIQRQSILTSYKGLGIVQTIGNIILTPTQEGLSATPPPPPTPPPT